MLIGSNPQISSSRFFLAGLRDLGYVEGKDYRVAARYAELQPQRLPALAAELVALSPAVIFADDVGSAIPARRATSAVPIVCAMLGDPVEDGLAQSLAHPGGNVTGLSSSSEGLLGKQMEVAARAVNHLREVGVLIDLSFGRARSHRSEAEAAAEKLGLAPVFAEVRSAAELDAAISQIAASAR